MELRQGLHQGRAFNLTREILDARFLTPWRGGGEVVLDEHRYSPARGRLKVLCGPELAPEQIGLGRGWQNAERAGRDMTDELLRATGEDASDGARGEAAATPLAAFKLAVEGACTLEPRSLSDLVELAAARHPGSRVSEQLALAERAVWELLHAGRLSLHAARAGEPVAPEAWPELLLAWPSWRGESGPWVAAVGRG